MQSVELVPRTELQGSIHPNYSLNDMDMQHVYKSIFSFTLPLFLYCVHPVVCRNDITASLST
jgi:hypothetical protein